MTRLASSSLVSVAVAAALAVTTGCHASTQAKFVIPPSAQLAVNGQPVTIGPDGTATMSAFGWGGASYTLSRNGKTVREGKLDTKFRPISIFWPPFGVAYVPMGLDDRKTYDLTKPDASKTAAK